MTMRDLDKEITEFIVKSVNESQRGHGLPDNLSIDANISDTNIDDATLVNLLIELESAYEIYFEDKQLHRNLYVTLIDIRNVIVYKIKRKEEFLWGESILI
jgi:hypothetical protein